MPRPSEEKAKIEAQRLEILHREQSKIRRRITRETRVKKAGYHLPGEESHKKDLAVFIKLSTPGISFTEIANRIGETKTTVRGWFRDDPQVKEFYEWAISNLKEGTLQYLQTLGFEASETLAVLMRYGSEKSMLDAANSILDRVGVAKVSRQEIEAENKRSHNWSDRNELVEDIRQLPPEQQEEAIEALERFEELLAKEASSANKQTEPESEEEFEEEEVDDGE